MDKKIYKKREKGENFTINGVKRLNSSSFWVLHSFLVFVVKGEGEGGGVVIESLNINLFW